MTAPDALLTVKVLVVMVEESISSENVPVIAPETEPFVALSAGLVDETVGAVVSVVVVELSVVIVLAVSLSSSDDTRSSIFAHDETSTAMLTIKTNQDNKLFILFLFIKIEKVTASNLYRMRFIVVSKALQCNFFPKTI